MCGTHQLPISCRRRQAEFELSAELTLLQPLANEPVFIYWKMMPSGQWQFERVTVIDLHNCSGHEIQSVGNMTQSSGRPALQWTARESKPMHDQDKNSTILAACHVPARVLNVSLCRLATLGTGWKIDSTSDDRFGSSS